MKRINMDTIKLLVEDKFYEYSIDDRNSLNIIIENFIDNLDNVKIFESINFNDISAESLIVEGLYDYMEENDCSVQDLWLCDDYSELLEIIYE